MEVIVTFDNVYQIKDETDIGTIKVLMLKGERGEQGYSGDYEELANRPQINGVTLTGNKTATQLSLATTGDVTTLQAGIDNNARDIAGLDDDITQVADDVSALDTSLSDAQADISNLQAQDDTHTAQITALQTAVENRVTAAMLTPTQIVPSVPAATGVDILEGAYVYRTGYVVDVNVEIQISSSFGSDWTTILSGLPLPVHYVTQTFCNWASSYKRPLNVRIDSSGNMRCRYGDNSETSYWIHMVYISSEANNS